MEREGQLVRSLKSELKDINMLQQVAKDTRKFDDFSKTYTHSVPPMLAELRSLILSAEDNLFDATRSVYGWCGTANDLLVAYTSLFEQHTDESAEAQNQIIESLFSEDITTPVLTKLNELSDNLNRASRTVSSITSQFDQDFSEQSAFFESTLRDEFVKDKNKRYTPELINNAVRALRRFRDNPEQSIKELATAERAIKIAQTALGNQHEYVPDAAFPLGNQQQQQHEAVAESFPTNQQEPQAPQAPTTTQPSTIVPQIFIQYKERVLSQFDQTRDFFENFGQQLNEIIRHINDVKSRLFQNNQRNQTPKVNGNSAIVPLSEAQKNQLKRAAQTLINQCQNFKSTPLHT